jgi:hypothetical protein
MNNEVHVHHWRIAMQSGATSPGVCACGMQKDFRNSWEEPASPLRNHHIRRYGGREAAQ